MEPRKVDAGQGWQWIVTGFELFKKNALIWIVLTIVLLIITAILNRVGLIGSLLLTVCTPILVGGLMLGCKALDQGDELEIGHLFAGFRMHTTDLLALGGIYIGAQIAIIFVAGLVAGTTLLSTFLTGAQGFNMAGSMKAAGGLMLAVLVALALFVPVMMAMWFAPTLVMLENLNVAQSLKYSFNACLKNFVPFLVYGFVLFIASIIALIPFGLGLLILIPVIFTSTYAGYKDIFQHSGQVIVDVEPI